MKDISENQTNISQRILSPSQRKAFKMINSTEYQYDNNKNRWIQLKNRIYRSIHTISRQEMPSK